MNEKKIKIGLIGVGGFGEKRTEAILKSKNLELVLCFHENRARAEEYAKKYHCQSAPSPEVFFASDVIQAIVVATPNHLHYEHIKKCINGKKHIFVEKPITNNLEEAREVIKECDKGNLILMVGHNFRRNNAIRKIKELMSQEKIGKFVSAEINMSHSGGMKLTPQNWRYYKDKCPGGPLMMLGTHSAEVSNYLFGRAKQVAAVVKKLYAPSEAQDTSLLLLELEAGGNVYICNNYNVPATHFIRIYGTKGILIYDRNLEALFFQGEDINKKPVALEPIEFEHNDTLLEEMEEFGDCILYNRKPEVSGREAFDALAIVEAALNSSQEKRFVKVEHYDN